MILEVLEVLEPAVFHHNLSNTLTHYYEEIQSMSGAGGRPKPKSFKLKMNVGDGLSLDRPATAIEDNNPAPPPAAADLLPPADDGTAAATPATPHPKQNKGVRGKAKCAKA